MQILTKSTKATIPTEKYSAVLTNTPWMKITYGVNIETDTDIDDFIEVIRSD